MTSTLLRRTGPAAAALVSVVLTACGDSGSTPQPPGAAASSGGGGDSYDSIIQGGPTADASAISASSWAQAVKTRTMPLGNVTEITEAERSTLGSWIAAGSKLN